MYLVDDTVSLVSKDKIYTVSLIPLVRKILQFVVYLLLQLLLYEFAEVIF